MKKPISLAMLLFVVLAFGGFGAASASPVGGQGPQGPGDKNPVCTSQYTFNNCIVTVYIINGCAQITNVVNTCCNTKKCDNNKDKKKCDNKDKNPTKPRGPV